MASSSSDPRPGLTVPFPKTSGTSRVPAWVKETRGRLEETDEQRACSIRARGEKRYWVASQMQERMLQNLDFYAAAAGKKAKPLTAEEAQRQGEQKTLDFCRRNLGMKSVMFEPQGSTVYILGRPLQVFLWCRVSAWRTFFGKEPVALAVPG